MTSSPTLHLVCGKIAAGKSTLTAQLARAEGTVLISEDPWLHGLFADRMETGRDFVTYSGKLRATLAPHIVELLQNGVSVVLDFAANTRDQRAWMRSLIDAAGCDHQLHVLNPPDEVCLERLHARNAKGEHPFAVTDAQFHQFSKYFDLPGDDEGFAVVMYDVSD